LNRVSLRTLAAALVVSVGIGGALVACGGDDQYVQPGNTGDAGHTDAGPSGDGGHDGGPVGDGGDSGCAFTAFVINQVTTQKLETNAPVANANVPDPTCSLTGSTSDYSSLFSK
jgi:hypothetical protein